MTFGASMKHIKVAAFLLLYSCASGYAQTVPNRPNIFTVIDLSAVPGANNAARALNDSGEVAGRAGDMVGTFTAAFANTPPGCSENWERFLANPTARHLPSIRRVNWPVL